MRILLLAPHPFFTERGTPIAVRLAATALAKAGHRIDLLTFHEGEDVDIPGVRLIRIRRPFGVSNVPIGFSLKKLVCDAAMAGVAAKLIRRERYDVVHAVEESVYIALAGRVLGRFRLVYDMDSLMTDQIAEKWPRARLLLPLLRAAEAWAVRRADLVLPVCRAIADRVAPVAGVDKVHLLPDVAFEPPETPVAVEDLRAGVAAGDALALYVGNLEHYQGIGLLIDAFAALPPGSPVALVLIGGADGDVARYREKTAALGLAARIHFLGPRPLANLPGFLAQADILCSPRLHGVNTPMKIYSYMLAGKAILATDIQSHAQVLDESCAALVPPDARALAAELAALVAAPERRERLGAAAADRARGEYSLAAFERRLDDAYATLGVAAA